jgi:hypothetical protein
VAIVASGFQNTVTADGTNAGILSGSYALSTFEVGGVRTLIASAPVTRYVVASDIAADDNLCQPLTNAQLTLKRLC